MNKPYYKPFKKTLREALGNRDIPVSIRCDGAVAEVVVTNDEFCAACREQITGCNAPSRRDIFWALAYKKAYEVFPTHSEYLSLSADIYQKA